eukprot:symbB.v1.2.012060.t1/scaffold825.1/size159525/1
MDVSHAFDHWQAVSCLLRTFVVPCFSHSSMPAAVSSSSKVQYGNCYKLSDPKQKMFAEMEMRDDPLRFPNIGLGWPRNMRWGTAGAFSKVFSTMDKDMAKAKYPFLIIHDPEDKICLVGGSEKLMERSPSADKQLSRMEAGGFHCITFVDQERYVGLQTSWMKQRAALEASFDDARREVEHQTRRRYMAEHALATARTEIGRLKAAYMAMQVEREEWLKREEQFRETFSLTEARAEQSTLEAQKAQNELRLCREELAEFQHAQLAAGSAAPVHDACGFVHSSLQGGDIEAEVLELCQRLEEEAKVLTVKLDREDGNADAESGRKSHILTMLLPAQRPTLPARLPVPAEPLQVHPEINLPNNLLAFISSRFIIRNATRMPIALGLFTNTAHCLRQALLASVAPNPTRDVQRKTVDPQKEQDLFADVLNNYCDPTVQHDFDQLGAEAKRKMLKALQVTIEETAQSVSLNKMMKAASQGVNAASQDVKTCPITRALSLHQSCSVNREVIDLLRTQILPLWGSIVPKPIQLFQHQQGLAQMLRENEGHNFRNLSTNSTVMKPAEVTPHNWASLREVGVKSLRLFDVAKGSVLVGILLVDPIVQVGISTILEDAAGDHIQLGLYNQLPGGAVGPRSVKLAQRHFPKGAHVRIAEPFLKIFRDGKRGVRVDDPRDVRSESRSACADLSTARETGKKLFAEMQFQAALFEYWQSLRSHSSEVAILLSNRAQAAIKQERWEYALR